MTCRLFRLGLSLPNVSEKNRRYCTHCHGKSTLSNFVKQIWRRYNKFSFGFSVYCELINPLRFVTLCTTNVNVKIIHFAQKCVCVLYRTCTVHVPYMYRTFTIHVPYKYRTCTSAQNDYLPIHP